MSYPVDFLGGGGCEEWCMCAWCGSGKPVPTTYCACFVSWWRIWGRWHTDTHT